MTFECEVKDYRNINQLREWDQNPRGIKKDKFEELKKRLSRFDQIKPIIITPDGEVLGGNMRLKAYRELGVQDIWVSVVEPKTEAEKVEIALTDNEEMGYYEDQALAELIDKYKDEIKLGDYSIHLGQPISLEDLLAKFGPEPEEDEVPEVTEEAVSVLGEVYQLGRHRVMCGDSTKIEDVEKLMDGKKADMVFTDPPYGIGYDDNMWEGIRGYDIESKRMGVIKGDDKPYDPSFLLETFKYVKEMFIWGFQFYPEKLGRGGVVAWIKKTEAQKNMLYGDFELCWSKQERNKMFLFPWGGFNNKERSEGERWHPTQKPVGIIDLMIKQWGKENDIVTDLFLGSGSTLIACEQTNRTCFGMELDPRYVDVIRKRYAKFIGKEEEWEKITPSI